MSALGQDRPARLMLGASFGAAALLVLVALWSASGDAPEHWARALHTIAPMAACVAAAAVSVRGAWRRRAEPALWVPLAGGAATALAAVAAALAGRV
jgi:multisubunit Na+/H+ antiporter MnhE subunit